MEIFAFFGTVIVAGLLSFLFGKRRMPGQLLPLVTAPFLALSLVLNRWLPFKGVWTELLVCFAGSLSFVWFVAWIRGLPPKGSPGSNPIGAAGIFPLFLLVLMPLVMRVGYARKLAWACDGRVVEQYRSSNHRAFGVRVEGSSGIQSFEAVDETFWQRAQQGRHVVKKAGSPSALVDGESLRMLPRCWWKDIPGEPEPVRDR